MMPGLGKKFPVEIEVISKPRKEYQSDDYKITGMPSAPAIMMDNKLVATKDVSLDFLEKVIHKHLGMDS